MTSVRITFDGDNKEVVADSETSLLNISLNEGIQHVHMCQGNGRCSTCRVLVLEGEKAFTRPRLQNKRSSLTGTSPRTYGSRAR